MTDFHILSLREQDVLHNEWLAYRLEQILPKQELCTLFTGVRKKSCHIYR